MKNPDTFCLAPFLSVEVRKDGKLAPCCRFTYEVDPRWHFRNFDHWWKEDLKGLRQDLMSGIKNPGCANCWRDQELGVSSYRDQVNNQWNEYIDLVEPLEWPIDQMYNFGSFCNLKCIMCNPYASSSIETEYLMNKKYFNDAGIIWNSVDKEHKWYQSDAFVELKEQISLPARFVQLQGGEPLLSPDALDFLSNMPFPDLVTLVITTNMTTLDDDIINILKRFKEVRLTISLEGTGKHNDYIRFGSRWSDIEANVDRVVAEGFKVIIAHTLQRTSLKSLPNLFAWANSRNLKLVCNLLDWPPYLSVNSAPDSERQTCLEQLGSTDKEYLEKFLQGVQYDANLDARFKEYLMTLDQLRQTDFRQVFGY